MFNFIDLLKNLYTDQNAYAGDVLSHDPPEHTIAIKFLENISPTDKYNEKICWEWSGPTGIGNYGTLYLTGADLPIPKKGNSISAHRFSFWLFHKQYPGPSIVRHKCDNSICVNPYHLELGTTQDNLNDRREKISGKRNKKIICEFDSYKFQSAEVDNFLSHAKYWKLKLIEHKFEDLLEVRIYLNMGDMRKHVVESFNPFKMLYELTNPIDPITIPPSTTEGGKAPAIHIDEEIFPESP